jgi:DNA-binding CsgD family transcriptional regulator
MGTDFLSSVEATELERLGDSVGTSQFYQTLLRVVSTLIPGDFESIAVYSKRTRPQLLHFEATPRKERCHDVTEIVSLYNSAFFRFDPFFRYWREIFTPGVVPLYEIPDLLSRDELYVTSYMPAMQMKDDVVILLPLPENRAIALGRERSWRYETEEIDRLKLLYPLLAGLNKAHLRAVNTGATVERYMGNESKEPAQSPLDFSTAVHGFTASGFTPREREILSLLLAGFPSGFIAKRLEIGIGTVRNHRKRLYTKLDVTSEREIFSLFIGYLTNEETSSLIE